MPEGAVLVTGATGFVGANVVERIAAGGVRVVASDLIPPPEPVEAIWAPHRDLVEFVALDVREREEVADVISGRGVDSVVHGATLTPDAQREAEEPDLVVDVGIVGTAAVLRACSGLGVGRFVYLSSASIYEPVQDDGAALGESAGLRNSGLYPLTKVAGEWLVRHARETGGTDAVSARLSACYGPLERDTGSRAAMSPVWRMLRLAREGVPFVPGEPERVLDFTHVRDVAEGVRNLLESPLLVHDAYNVSCGKGSSYRELAERVTVAVERTWKAPRREGAKTVKIPSAQGSRRGRLSVERLSEETGFWPRHDLASGLEQYVAWLRDNEY